VWTVDNMKDSRRALVSTVGARGSWVDPNVQRLYRNAVLWCLGQDSDSSQSPAAPLETVLLKESPEALARDARKVGNVERGRKLFYDAAVGCAKCHDPAAGPPLGPNLLEKRETKDTHLVESILKPSEVILEGYQNALVVTQAGETHTGFHVAENDQTLQLRDSVLGEKTWEFKKSELLLWERVNTSTMPAGLVNLLKDRSEFLDLVRFVMAGAEGTIPRQSETQGAPRK
jgi:putative heme-binding domain-containing protein